jgi:hypothetical protein
MLLTRMRMSRATVAADRGEMRILENAGDVHRDGHDDEAGEGSGSASGGDEEIGPHGKGVV